MSAAGGSRPRRRLCVRSGGFLTEPRIRRILSLEGWDISIGTPVPGDAVGVWGHSPTSHRGARLAARTGVPLVRIEDAPLRSLFPGRAGEPTLGLLIDETGVHFDASAPSDLETLLATHPLDDPALLARAEAAIAAMARAHLSKFAATDPDLPLPEPGFILVIDQTRGDAAVTASGGTDARFAAMLKTARAEHPDRPVLVKTHPETASGFRTGHFSPKGALTGPHSPWRLFGAARAVYTLSSGLGFEAILAGHKPVVFGTPFYAGWGLSDDRSPIPRRSRRLSRVQLAAAALILAPSWYDPYRDRLSNIEDVIRALAAQARAWRDDRHGWTARAMSRWKRPHLRAFFGRHGGIAFSGAHKYRRSMVWASAARPGDDSVRVEDGFLRSRGLGARLTPPLSLALDDLGIYYDPSRPSRLETLIAESPALTTTEIEHARALIIEIRRLGLTKYNIAGDLPGLPQDRPRILVAGQVEDDASLRLGAGAVATNADLLARTARENPDATLIYKPHPDVEAGLRHGRVTPPEGVFVATRAGADALLGAVDAVWTMTSLLGFEALLRGLPVTVTGAPFYAGWGLTRDLGHVPERRAPGPTLEGLVHAALIAYPRYHDPVTGLACPVEVAMERLAHGPTRRAGGMLAALQRMRGRLRQAATRT
ncbi:MAG: capsular polysaccharide biosynthesis protein [Pseudomonadota bacterium]